MAHPVFNTLKAEWQYLGDRRKLFVFYISLFVIACVVSLFTPYVIGLIFNSIQNSIISKQELNALIFKIFLLLVITVVFWLFHGTARILENTTSYFVRKNFVNDKIKKVLELPVKWHKDTHSGDTIEKINRAANSLEDFSGQMTYELIYGIINLFGSIAILLFIDWRIGLFAFFFSLIIFFIIARVDKNLNGKYKELNKYSYKLSATIFDYISNVLTVISLRLKKIVSKEIDDRQIASYPTFKSSIVINELKWGFASVAIQIMVVSMLIYKAYTEFNLTGTILIGTLYMVYGYLNNVGDTFYKFAGLYGRIIRVNARIIGANPIDEEYNKLEYPESSRLPRNWNKIDFKNVSFTYDAKGKINHLENINFRFKKGEKIALVGESGSGKSTILSLIRGLYNIERGEVLCNGKKLPLGIHTVKDNVTLIPQEPEIFNNTFRYNITMSLPVSEHELDRVISMAQVKPILEKLPRGFETNVMEKGVSLSGGEKQRLALARGLLAAEHSDIVLLDEPTSSVDSLNEMKIHENVFSEFKNKTIIASIHRLHLLDRFDYIYLFSRGKIIGHGTFSKIQKNPVFGKMWQKYTKEKKKK